MVNLVLPTKYAEALFAIAKENKELEKVRDELIVIKKVFEQNPKLKNIINHPGISRDEKKKLVNEVFGAQISKLTVHFMLFLVEKKREKLFDAICDVFIEKADISMGIRKITIETAYRLDDTEKGKIVKQLEKATKKKLKVDTRVNAGMMGGIIIRERMKLIDASVSQFLNSLKDRLHIIKVIKPAKKAKGKNQKAKKKKAKKAAKKKTGKKVVKKKPTGKKKPVKKIKVKAKVKAKKIKVKKKKK